MTDTERILLVDTYEKELALMRRNMRAALSLLTDARAANESGRTHVVRDHLDRAIDKLRATDKVVTDKVE